MACISLVSPLHPQSYQLVKHMYVPPHHNLSAGWRSYPSTHGIANVFRLDDVGRWVSAAPCSLCRLASRLSVASQRAAALSSALAGHRVGTAGGSDPGSGLGTRLGHHVALQQACSVWVPAAVMQERTRHHSANN